MWFYKIRCKKKTHIDKRVRMRMLPTVAETAKKNVYDLVHSNTYKLVQENV